MIRRNERRGLVASNPRARSSEWVDARQADIKSEPLPD